MRAAIGSGLKTAFGNTALMAANLGRDISIARLLGAGATSDALFLAMAVPVFFVMVATLGFRSAVLPFFEKLRRDEGTDIASRCLASVVFWTCAAFVVLAATITLVATFAQAQLTDAGAGHGFGAALPLLVMCLPMFFVSAAAMLFDGPLQADGRFLMPALLRISMPVGFAVGLWWGAEADPILYGLVGGHIGAVVQCLATALLVRRAGFAVAIAPAATHPQLPAFRAQYGYLLLAGAITYFNPLVSQWMAAPLGTGAASTFAYANRLSAGISTLAIGSITPTLLAHFSRAAAQEGRAGLSSSFEKSCLLLTWISCGGVLFTWLLAAPVVRLLYQGQALGAAQTQYIADFLSLSIVQLVPMSLGICAASMLSATAHNRVLVPVGVLLVTINVAGNLLFTHLFGLTGLALSAILMYCCSMLVMHSYLHGKGLIVLRGAAAVELCVVVAGFGMLALVAHSAGLVASQVPAAYQFIGIAALAAVAAVSFLLWARIRLARPRPAPGTR